VGGKGLSVLPLLVTSPTEAFRRLAVNPQWLGPFLLVACLIAAATWIRLPQDLMYAQEGTIRGMERLGLSDEDIDEALAQFPDVDNLTVGAAAIQVLQGLLGTIAFQFLAVLVLHWIARIGGAQPRFRETLAVYWTANVASAVGALVLGVLVRTQDTVEVYLSPAALFPGLAHASLPALFLDIFDLFSLITLWLLVTGVRVVLRCSDGAAWGIGGGFWALTSLVRFAMLAGFSWFSGTL
jgi:hypothetical protein